MNNSWTSAKKWFGLGYINSEDYELDLKFDGNKIKRKAHRYLIKNINPFARTLYSLWNNFFHQINLTYGSTFSPVLIKQEKIRINQKINFPRDTKQCLEHSDYPNIE